MKIEYTETAYSIAVEDNEAIWYDDKGNQIADLGKQLLFDIQTAKKDKQTLTVTLIGMKYVSDYLMRLVKWMGFDINNKVGSKKDLKVRKGVRYLLTKTGLFYLQIRVSSYSTILIQNGDNIIGTDSISESKEDALKKISLMRGIRKEFTKGLKRPNGRILYSVSQIARTMYNRNDQQYRLMNYINKKVDGIPQNQYLEDFYRPGYHGGYNYMTDQARTYEGPGIILDSNSMYGYVQCERKYPTTEIQYIGRDEPINPLWQSRSHYIIAVVKCRLHLKPDGIPCIMKDKSVEARDPYITDCKLTRFTVNETDLKMMYDNYDVDGMQVLMYIVFGATKNAFRSFLSPYYERKQKASGIERDVIKNIITHLYGSFAKRTFNENYIYADTDAGIITKVVPKTKEEREKERRRQPGLCYVGGAITSYGREYIISMIKSIPNWQDRFLYTDTDSIHLKGIEIPKGIPISDKMGDFKIEHTFETIRYKGLKCYAFIENGKLVIKASGISKLANEYICNGVPEWARGSLKSNIFKRQIHKIDTAVSHRHIDKIFETCIPDMILVPYRDRVRISINWHKIVKDTGFKKIRPVHISPMNGDIGKLRAQLARYDKWYETHKEKPLPLDQWLAKMHEREEAYKERSEEEFQDKVHKFDPNYWKWNTFIDAQNEDIPFEN